jgi:phytoene synthase
MKTAVGDSYSYCQSLARRTGRNFYFSFLTLPRRLFRDMCVLYAFMRHTDDLGDSDERSVPERRTALRDWRAALDAALQGQSTHSRILPALADVTVRHGIPSEYLHDVISGVESDLTPRGFQSFPELSQYCYHVAGAVGLCCIHIWGFRGDEARSRAIDCGLAFQLTNLLRDLGEDAQMGRVYLPQDELQRFGYTEDDLRNGVQDERFRALMQFQVARARQYYASAADLHQHLSPAGRPVFSAMFRIYSALLSEIEKRDYDVFTRRIRVSSSRKLAIAWSSLFGRRHRAVPRPAPPDADPQPTTAACDERSDVAAGA